ncbi:MAG TPA: PAS domain-containing sensor histidine kinase [Ignavibacteriales bacterium]|nr:PAS domain-containing sensor histidine kinase [Ignavibacteriales bacterium]
MNKLHGRTDDFYFHLFENSKSVMLVIDPETAQIADANNAAAEFYGYSKEKLSSMKITEINLLAEEEIFQEMKLDRQSGPVYFNFRHRLSSGEVRSVEVYSSKVKLNDKEYLYSVIHDITEKTRLQARLSEIEKSYRLIFENSMDGILLTDPNGEIFHANKAAVEMLGRTEEEICRLGRNGIVDTSDPRLKSALAERTATGRFFGELRYNKKNGTVFPVEISSSIFTLEDGRNRTITIFRDLTEKKKMELSISQSEKRFRALFQNSSDVIVLVDKDKIIQYVSSSVTNVLGYSQEEVLGSQSFLITNAADLSGALYFYNKVLTSKNETIRTQLRIRNKNNNYIWVEVTAVNMLDDPFVNAIVVNYRDIDEQKKSELKLRESEKSLAISESRYRTLASNIPNGAVVLFDKNLKFILAEGTELARLGFDKTQMAGKSISETLPADISEVVAPHWKATLNGSMETFEVEGPGNIYEIRTVPIRDDLGNIVSGMELLQNITMRKKNEKELKQLNESKDKFFSIIAHDLKGPFTSVLGFSEFLQNYIDELGKEDIKNFSANIYKSAKAIFNLLENLLQWSRLQSGRMEFNPGRINLNELIEENVIIYQASSLKKNIGMDFNAGREIYVNGDRNMVDAVLRNILSNSVKFTNPGGTIKIEANTHQGHAVVAVKDNGIGISKANLEKLFVLGESPLTLGTNNEKGTGLGLLLCNEFIKKNKGTINVESRIGEGTLFTFTLPLYDEQY